MLDWFQFLIGRLDTAFQELAERQEAGFQFLIGRLDTGMPLRRLPARYCFNSS